MQTNRLPPTPDITHPVHSVLQSCENATMLETNSVFAKDEAEWLRGRIAFTIPNVLSKKECDDLIAISESSIGFEKALLNVGGGRQVLDENVRKSQRCIIDSVPLADEIWNRVKACIPQEMNYGNQLVHVVGINERLRLLKYFPGDQFAPHWDGTFSRPYTNEFSQLTLQIYLNDVEEGGETTMWSDNEDIEEKIVCEPGKAVIFSHQIYHEGSEVKKGVKYVIRTDIMYNRV